MATFEKGQEVMFEMVPHISYVVARSENEQVTCLKKLKADGSAYVQVVHVHESLLVPFVKHQPGKFRAQKG